jgi:hypothetical protein
MPGLLTDGLTVANTSDGSFPFTGVEKINVDTNLANGQNPQSVAATTAQLLGVLTSSGPHNSAYAAAVTIDGANGQIQTVGALTGAITLSWANIVPGVTYRLKLVQDATGTRVATLTGGSTTWKVSGSQSTTASYVDWLTFWFDGTTYWGVWNTHFA